MANALCSNNYLGSWQILTLLHSERPKLYTILAFLSSVWFVHILTIWNITELDASKKQAEADKKSIDGLVRERDLLHKEMLKAVSATTKQLSLVKLHEQSKKNLEQEISNYKEEAQKQRKIIYQLEKERDRYINEASDLTQKVRKIFQKNYIHVSAYIRDK